MEDRDLVHVNAYHQQADCSLHAGAHPAGSETGPPRSQRLCTAAHRWIPDLPGSASPLRQHLPIRTASRPDAGVRMKNAPVPEQQVSNQTASSPAPKLTWDIGTAYDFFLSLEVLHNPEEYALRPSWAAGVRSRLPPDERKLLEDIQHFIWVPVHWVYTLPAPKDAATAIWTLRQIPPAHRPLALDQPVRVGA